MWGRGKWSAITVRNELSLAANNLAAYDENYVEQNRIGEQGRGII